MHNPQTTKKILLRIIGRQILSPKKTTSHNDLFKFMFLNLSLFFIYDD